MKITLIISIFGLFGSSVFAQSLAPWVVSTAGGSGDGTDFKLSWTLGEPAIETFSNSQFILTEGFQQPFDPYRFSGVMQYMNAGATPLPHSVAYLTSPGGNELDSALTTHNGNFYFFHVVPGTYLTWGKTELPWGGANATDALLILKHFVHLQMLSGMYEDAGDVNLSGSLNSLDALLVAKRFVGSISAFLLSDWLFSRDTIQISAVPGVHNIKALCAGDVNGTHNPAAKLAPSVFLISKDFVTCRAGQETEIPLLADSDLNTAAISLVLDLPEKIYQIHDVQVNTKDGTLLWKRVGDQLRIAWYSLQPFHCKAGDKLITLHVLINADLDKVTDLPVPVAGETSELASFNGMSLQDVKLRFPRILNEQYSDRKFINCCSPNPSEGLTKLTYTMNKAGKLTIRIFDLPGRLLEEQQITHNTAGSFDHLIHAEKFPPGYYIINATVVTSSDTYSSTAKISIVK